MAKDERPLREGMWFERLSRGSLPSSGQLEKLVQMASKALDRPRRKRSVRRGCPTGRLHPSCELCQYPADPIHASYSRTKPKVTRAGLRGQRKEQRQARQRSQAAMRARR